jgi:hypothetical protein
MMLNVLLPFLAWQERAEHIASMSISISFAPSLGFLKHSLIFLLLIVHCQVVTCLGPKFGQMPDGNNGYIDGLTPEAVETKVGLVMLTLTSQLLMGGRIDLGGQGPGVKSSLVIRQFLPSSSIL